MLTDYLTEAALKDFQTWLHNHPTYGGIRWKTKVFTTNKIIMRAYILKWFDHIGLLLDRDADNWQYKLWDWREGEPEDYIPIDVKYVDGALEGWEQEAIEFTGEHYNKTFKNNL